jgi:hypothetical protein
MSVDFIIYKDNVITHEQEQRLIDFIDSRPWINGIQTYGVIYNSSNGSVSKTTPIPIEWLKLFNINAYKCSIVVREYMPGQGIAPHLDSLIFCDNIICYSLGSGTTIRFSHYYKYKDFYIQPRSSYMMYKDSRYKWAHEIQPLKFDGNIPRKRRISITIRWLI